MNIRGAIRVAGIGCVLLLPLIVSCGANIKDINTDPSFTAKKFADGGLAILGCTSVVVPDPDDLALSKQYTGPLREAINEKQRGVEVETWDNIQQTLGDDEILKCLKEFRESGTLDPATLGTLKGKLAGKSRYLLVQRIARDQLKFSQDEEQSNVEGEMGSVVTGYILGTERIVSVGFSIYDLEESKRVCDATVESSKGDTHEVGVSQVGTIGGLAGTVVDVKTDLDEIFNDDENPISKFPRPPSQKEIVERIYSRFAAQLPAAQY